MILFCIFCLHKDAVAPKNLGQEVGDDYIANGLVVDGDSETSEFQKNLESSLLQERSDL